MTFAPASIDTTVPGSIGIIGDTRSVALDRMTSIIRFEEPAGMPCADGAGGLDELSSPGGAVMPTKTLGALGTAAVFGSTGGGPTVLQAKDLRVGGTLLPRDLTVQAMISWDTTAQNAYGPPGTIIARGLGTGAVEYMPFALELHVLDTPSRTGEIRWLWHTAGGLLKTETGASFICPPAGNFFLLTATRRWVSPTSVVIRYYANDQLLGEVASADGDIAAAVDGTTTIGSRFIGAAYGNLLAGSIDELAIFNFEMCREEIEATWLRISLYQPDGYRQMQDNMPPGIRISNDPNSQIQSDLRSMGLGLGLADAQIENVRANMMPDRAYGNVLRRWEAITRQPAQPGDSIDTRRKRVAGQTRKRGGASPPSVTEALADLLACNASQLQVLAFDNTIRDTFATLAPERWTNTAGWTTLANAARVQAVAGSYPWDAGNFAGLHALIGVERARGLGTPTSQISLFAAMNPIALPANAEAGILLFDWSAKTMLFFGLRNVAGSFKVGYQSITVNNSIYTDSGFTVLATTALVKHWLRLRWSVSQGLTTSQTELYDASWSTVSHSEADLTTQPAIGYMRNIGWAGMYFRTFAATAGASDVRFDEFALRNALGTRPYNWFVYRDPAIGGSPDLVGANAVLARMRHGFTKACVITSKSVLYDDAGSGYDRGPLGAL